MITRRALLQGGLAATALAAVGTGATFAGAPAAQALTRTIPTIGSASYQCRRPSGSAYYDATANKTFVAWNGAAMDAYVRAFDHGTLQWGSPSLALDWNNGGANAYHDYSMLLKLPNGKPAIIQAHHTSDAVMATAPTANSVAGTWTKKTISTDKVCYPMPAVLGNEIYLFYSRNDDLSWPYRSFRYIKSSDNGATWTAPVTIIDTGKSADKFSEVYAFDVATRGTKIYLTWSLWGGPLGHAKQGKDIYCAYLETADGTMRAVNGTSFGSTVNLADHATARVQSSTPTSTNTHPLAQDASVTILSDGRVFIGYNQRTDTSTTLKAAVQNGSSWTHTTIATGTQIKDVVTSGTSVEVLSAMDGTVRAHRSADSGATWTQLYALAEPTAAGSDTTQVVNYVVGRQHIRAIGYRIKLDERDTNYTGAWPVYAITEV